MRQSLKKRTSPLPPGIQAEIGPADLNVPYEVIYIFGVKATCEGTDGSEASDSAYFDSDYKGSVLVTGGTTVLK